MHLLTFMLVLFVGRSAAGQRSRLSRLPKNTLDCLQLPSTLPRAPVLHLGHPTSLHLNILSFSAVFFNPPQDRSTAQVDVRAVVSDAPHDIMFDLLADPHQHERIFDAIEVSCHVATCPDFCV